MSSSGCTSKLSEFSFQHNSMNVNYAVEWMEHFKWKHIVREVTVLIVKLEKHEFKWEINNKIKIKKIGNNYDIKVT